MLSLIKNILKKEELSSTYTSCELLEHAFMFDHMNCLRACSMLTKDGTGRPLFKENYHGELINWKKVFKQKSEFRKIQKSGGTVDVCKGCNCLGVQTRDEKNYINELLLTHWTKCNSNCIYCPVMNSEHILNNTKYYNVLPAIKDAIKKKVFKKDGLIQFAGGESTIHPEFDELLKTFLDNGFTNIVINTSAINYKEIIEDGIRQNRVKLVTSPDSGRKETHLKIKRVDSFEQVWETLGKYSKAQIDAGNLLLVKTKYIIVPSINDNIEEFQAYLNKNKDAGIKYVSINLEMDWYQANYNSNTTPLYNLINLMKKTAEEQDFKCELYPQASWIIQEYKNENN